MTRYATVNAPKRRFSVAEYHQLADVGILKEDDQVELIQGEIIQMSPIGPKHAGNLDRLVRFLTLLLKESAIVRPQNPVRLSNISEPEPDIAILRPREDFYTSAHPGPEDVLLVIELSETTLQYDQEVKLPLYAAAGIPEYWIVDLQANRVLVYRDASGEQFLNIKTYQQGEIINSAVLPQSISVEDLLP